MVTTHVTKNALHFNYLKFYRYPTVPRADVGRNGDVIIVDSITTQDDPPNVGLWIKLPTNDSRAAHGTIVIGNPGAVSTLPGITINTRIVTFTNGADRDAIADDINYALIPNIIATAVGDAVQLIERTGGIITVSNNTLGLYSSRPLSELHTHGQWVPLQVSGSATAAAGQAQVFIEVPVEKTYTVMEYAVFNFALCMVVLKTNLGSITVSVQSQGVDLPGLGNLAVTTDRTVTPLYPLIPIHMGDDIAIVTSNNNGATDLSIMLGYKYKN